LQCSLNFSITLEEDPPSYISDVVVSPIVCPFSGEINFQCFSPDGTDVTIHVEIASDSYDFTVPSGEVLLGDFIEIVEGTYSISVSPTNSIGDCMESIEVQMDTQVDLIIDINEIINPSSVSANDGAIFGTILSTVPAPFELFVNANPIIIEDVGFGLEDLAEGSYSIYVINAEGCVSDTTLITLEADPEIESRISFLVGVSSSKPHGIPELPGNSTFMDRNYSVQLEALTGKKDYHPIVGVGISGLYIGGTNNHPVWELNCQWNKSFTYHQFQLSARAGFFANIKGIPADFATDTPRDYGVLLQCIAEYSLLENRSQFPYNLSLRAGGRMDISPFNRRSELFFALQMELIKKQLKAD
jgi:hypothetical protein